MPDAIERRFSTRLDCRYLVHTPERIEDAFTVFALHGYGMNAEIMLRLASTWFPDQRIFSMEAPYPFYNDWEKREVGYSWAAHTRSEESVRLHHEMLLHVLGESETPPSRRLLLGFSQPAGLNYRFAATHPDEIRGVIGVCGGVPGNWEEGSYKTVSASLLHIARAEDDAYPIESARDFPRRLRLRAADVEYQEYPGPHRFPSLAGPSVANWVSRKFAP